MDLNLFDFVLLPLLIFFARIIDVTLGTLRIVMIAKGQKKIAPFLGFFEVLVWLIAIGRIMQNLDNWVCYLAYGAGYATGNYIGIILEEKLAVGIVQLQIYIQKDAGDLIKALRAAGYGSTLQHSVGGASGNEVNVIYSIVSRNEVKKITLMLRTFDPDAFYSISDIRYVNKGLTFPTAEKNRWARIGK